jgi:hypothetical protein
MCGVQRFQKLIEHRNDVHNSNDEQEFLFDYALDNRNHLDAIVDQCKASRNKDPRRGQSFQANQQMCLL